MPLCYPEERPGYTVLCTNLYRGSNDEVAPCPLLSALGSCLCVRRVVGGCCWRRSGQCKARPCASKRTAWQEEQERGSALVGEKQSEGRVKGRHQGAPGTTRHEGHDLDWAVDAVGAHTSTRSDNTAKVRALRGESNAQSQGARDLSSLPGSAPLWRFLESSCTPNPTDASFGETLFWKKHSAPCLRLFAL